MAKTIETILTSLDLSTESPIDLFLQRLAEYTVISNNEISKVRNASVYTLPTVVKDKETEVKQKMYGIVTNEDDGAVALINKRTVLLAGIVQRLKQDLDTLAVTDLGVITTDTTDYINLSELNLANETGMYAFVLNKNPFLMFNKVTGNLKTQLLISGDSEIIVREFNDDLWSATSYGKMLTTKEIVDSLDSEDSKKPLSAKQGNELTKKIGEQKVRIDGLTNTVNILNSNTETNSSLLNELNTSHAGLKQKVDSMLNGANPAYDTFKELAEYIAQDQTNASAMFTQIKSNTLVSNSNKTKIENIEKKLLNPLKTDYLDLGLSTDYNVNSDSQIPTTKTAYEIAKSTGGTSNSPIKTYRKELYGSDWLRIAKVKDTAKMSSGIFTINLYGNYIEKNNLGPIPNTGTLSEFNIDTSKSVEEVKAILSTLTYVNIEGDDSYDIAMNDTGDTFFSVLRSGEEYVIMFIGGNNDVLFATAEINGWNTDVIIDGKYRLPTPITLNSAVGLENDKLIDLMWVGGHTPSYTDILTTSVFSLSCGLDGKGEVVSSILPITHAPSLNSSDSSGGSGGGGGGSVTTTGMYGLSSVALEKTAAGEIYVNGLFNFPATELLFNYVDVELKIENNLNLEYLDDIAIKEIEDHNAIQAGTILKANTQYYVALEGSIAELQQVGDIGLDIMDMSDMGEYWQPIRFKGIGINPDEWLLTFWVNGGPSQSGVEIYNKYFDSTIIKGHVLKKQFSNDRLKVLTLIIQVQSGTVYKNGELIGSIFSVADDDILEIVAPSDGQASISLYNTSTIQILSSYIDKVDRYILDIYAHDNFVGKTIRLLSTAYSTYHGSYDLFDTYSQIQAIKSRISKLEKLLDGLESLLEAI